jgi:hypothetical protein
VSYKVETTLTEGKRFGERESSGEMMGGEVDGERSSRLLSARHPTDGTESTEKSSTSDDGHSRSRLQMESFLHDGQPEAPPSP